jgi:hypothetical protein
MGLRVEAELAVHVVAQPHRLTLKFREQIAGQGSGGERGLECDACFVTKNTNREPQATCTTSFLEWTPWLSTMVWLRGGAHPEPEP